MPLGAGIDSGGSGSLGSSIATAEIEDGAVTLAKMADLAQDLFIGRTTASTGVPETATITAAARTVLDDTTVGAMVDTLGGAAAQGTGGIVRATSPALTTPNLGTPSAGVLTNCTGTAAGLTAGVASAVAVGGITGLGTNVATALAVNVGSAGAPVVNGGALGTPSSGTLTNCDGSPTLTAPTFGGTMTLRNVDARKDSSWKTVVDDAPGVAVLGQSNTTASPFLGNAASGNNKQDFAQIDAILPAWYRAGATITVRVRAMVSVAAQVTNTVDVEAKICADGTTGSDICTTSAQALTTSYADYDFVVTPTGRVPGECLNIRFATLINDTGGAHGSVGMISSISVIFGA